ncbi:MAG: hypothetical protein Q8P41_27140 [Pseudomonadota bacterium]|nr:hypothetical protein [Pseudomonadota bacterium]
MSLLLLLLACGAQHTPDAPAPEAPPAAAPPAAAPAAATAPAASSEARELTITLDPSEMAYDDDAGTVRFSPDSRVKAASYTHYVLDLKSLEAALGGRPSARVAVVVSVTGGTPEKWVPADPNAPQPLGGFEDITWKGRVVARAPKGP